MSFSSEVKQEVTLNPLDDVSKRAQLSAFLQINAHLMIVNKTMQLQIEIENAPIAKYMFVLIKERYGVEIELKVLKKQRLRKNNIYILRVLERGIEILEDVGIYADKTMRKTPLSLITIQANPAKAYLAGAFLASGSINAPYSVNYHLEIAVLEKDLAKTLQKLLARFDIQAKIALRRGKQIVYVKAADQIADFLKIIGAPEKTMEFEDVRIQRDFKNSLTRLDNCEVANEVKSIKAGSQQLDAIYKLIEHDRYNHLEQRLIDVGDLRMNYPEASLNELIEYYEAEFHETISKSGLQHRFKKILELANKLDEM